MNTVSETEGIIIKSILDINPGAVITIKKDRRFKKGHIKVTGTELRGDVEYIRPFENKPLQGHHEDYKKPLEVNWLCRQCHEKKHHD